MRRSGSGPAGREALSATVSAHATPDIALVRPAARLRGGRRLPGDKSISHRALLLAALAEGESRIDGAGDGADVRSTAGIVRALGATVERVRDDGRTVDYRVVSPGADRLDQPTETSTAGTPARACGSRAAWSPGWR